ncbi:MAG: DUF1127 domain-containing protein [Rhizobium sp.]|nr:MAG: DUF1127 domain-containing protein [Rhizobium sp.]
MAIDIERAALAVPATGPGREWRKRVFPRAALARFLAYLQKRETRWDLRELTDDQLDDIGMTRSEARIETGKSWFWD